MKRIAIRRISVFVTILLLFSVGIGSADTLGKESLQGLRGVHVTVANLMPDIEKDGLQKSSILTDVELKLRMVGIKVLTENEWLAEPGGPFLNVIVVSALRGDSSIASGLYGYHISVELRQVVILKRDLNNSDFAATWKSTGAIGTVGSNHVKNTLRDTVKDQVDEFINDYLEMNPK